MALIKKPSFRKLKRFMEFNSLLNPGGRRVPPSFIILGAQKAGTTSLFHYLSQHPLMGRARRKELHYFNRDPNYNKGRAWYHGHFPFDTRLRPGGISMECTPDYLSHPECPERIHDYNPELKMAVVLREPVSRAYSAWTMFHNFKNSRRQRHEADPRGFAEAVRQELAAIRDGGPYAHEDYVGKGLYAQQLERYFALFARENFYIIENRELRAEPRRVLNEVEEFLGLSGYDWPDSLLGATRHAGKYRSQMPDDVRESLVEFYRPHNERLFELLGRRFDWL